MFLSKENNELFDAFAKSALAAGSLDIKTKALIALSVSVSVDCIPCIKSYYKKAIDSGAGNEEISEALVIAMAVSAGSKRAKYAPVIEELQGNS